MKAIIPAAGLGTRFLPGTKCTPKEMLPVLDKPVIQYVVEEALDPEEVDDAIIVTSPGKPELLSYFQPDRSLENLLRERGKNAYADAVAHAGGMPVDFRYQYEPKGLGHAIRSAADAVAGENFLVLLGDYVVPNRDICDKMLAVSKEHGGASVIAVAACSPEEVSRYGVIAGERVGSLEGAEDVADAEPGAVWHIGGLVEKPAPEAAPSNLYIVGRYLLSPLVMDLLADQQAGKGGEIQLTDAMARSLSLWLDGHQRPNGCKRPPLCRCLLGRHRRARRIDAQVSLRASTFTGADFGSRPFFIRAAIAGSCSQKIYEHLFGAPTSTCAFSVKKLCYSKNSIASRLFLLNGRYLINY